jgi:CheY-like chemotaxis protein
VLLADDNEINREVAVELLSAVGIQADVAPEGQVALEMIRHNRYDLVLMDVQMPVVDGMDATRMLRGEPRQGLWDAGVKKMGATNTICVAASGVMLPDHSPLVGGVAIRLPGDAVGGPQRLGHRRTAQQQPSLCSQRRTARGRALASWCSADGRGSRAGAL